MKKLAAALVSIGIFLSLICTGCAAPTDNPLTPAESAVSSEEETQHVDAEKAVEIRLDQVPDDEVFLMAYNWYGKTYASKDSLNKTMLDQYSPRFHHAPRVPQETAVSFVIDSSESLPDIIRLTQHANTVRTDTGMPFDTQEIELTKEGDHSYCFNIDFRGFKMYYYLLECEWENGNLIKVAFAVEKSKN